MNIKIIKDCEVPAGSSIKVTKELKKHYKGIWSSMAGTYEVKIKKENCIEIK